MSPPWRLGKPGATLRAASHAMIGTSRLLAIACGAISTFLAAGMMLGTATIARPWLPPGMLVVGLVVLWHAFRRPKEIVVTDRVVELPSWWPGLAARRVDLATLAGADELALPSSNALSELLLRSSTYGHALVERSIAKELVERVRIRAMASKLSVQDAVTLVEIYRDPSRKPLGVIRHDDAWVAFDDINALPHSTATPYRGQGAIAVVMAPRDFRLLQEVCPGLPLQLIVLEEAL